MCVCSLVSIMTFIFIYEIVPNSPMILWGPSA